MLISIIVPVHNAKDYLARGIDSLLGQTFIADHIDDYEILLIENNSTDDSIEIIMKYLANYPKIIRYYKCNARGAAAARNFGVTMAHGVFMWFIDADDYVDTTAVEKLYRAAKKTKADLTMMGAKRIFKNGHTSYLSAIDPKEKNYKNRFVRYGSGPWQFLIRRNWWIENGFQFKNGIIHEDMELMSSLILYTDNFASVDEPLYYYLENDNSVLHKATWTGEYLDIFPALEGIYNRFKEKGALKKYHDDLEYFFIWNLLFDSAHDFKKFKEGHVGFKMTRKFLKKYFPKWRKNKYFKEKPFLFKLRRRLSYHGIVRK